MIPASSVGQAALALLQDTFGYPQFRGQQAEIIEHITQGGDALVLMPTGGGKSLCYQIPALLRSGVAIVISPLIALMQDQVDALQQLGVRAALINSTLEGEQVRSTVRAAFKGDIDLLYVAPERLLTEHFLSVLDGLNEARRLTLFAIDEAHCVSQWGHDFRPEYMQLSRLHERFPNVPRIALTATADHNTREEIRQQLGLEQAKVFIASFDRPNIYYQIVEKENQREQLLRFLQDHRGEAGIVYCSSRKKVEQISELLVEKGIDALPYHAGLSADTRQHHQRRFIQEEGIVMVATIAFGMGINKHDVRFVAHLDLPKSLEAYYQETGRAGRDGEPAVAWLCYGLQDVLLHATRIQESDSNRQHKQNSSARLQSLLAFCETATCRRRSLLAYFGENPHADCGYCDNCSDKPEVWDGTEAARKALSAIYRTGMRFGSQYITDILLGKLSDKIVSNGHQSIPTFGIGKNLSQAIWRSVLRQLVASDYLSVSGEEFGALKLTERAKPLIRGEQAVQFRRPKVGTTSVTRLKRGAHPVSELTEFEEVLYQKLRKWRTETSKSQGVPSYVILQDRSLIQLCKEQPRTLSALHGVVGFGQQKVERYGAEILLLVRE